MPNPLELPGMGRAVVPLMSPGDAIVGKFVSHRLPRLSAIVRALDDLSEPAAALRCIHAVRVNRRSLDVEDLPSGEVGSADVPLFALAVRGQDECALACACQNPYFAHLSLPSRFR